MTRRCLDKAHHDMIYTKASNVQKGKIVEGKVSAPPCTNDDTVKQWKLGNICNFIKNISENKEAFLKLMKFSKQSPVYLESDEEYDSIFKEESITGFGFSLDSLRINNKVSIREIN